MASATYRALDTGEGNGTIAGTSASSSFNAGDMHIISLFHKSDSASVGIAAPDSPTGETVSYTKARTYSAVGYNLSLFYLISPFNYPSAKTFFVTTSDDWRAITFRVQPASGETIGMPVWMGNGSGSGIAFLDISTGAVKSGDVVLGIGFGVPDATASTSQPTIVADTDTTGGSWSQLYTSTSDPTVVGYAPLFSQFKNVNASVTFSWNNPANYQPSTIYGSLYVIPVNTGTGFWGVQA